ncbi:bitter taste receptor Modo-T2R62 precursor [Monodelphis domestica]|uniref:Taste receptor type 2 n=1 Tax=Monodelphis domestica TaxID=13616 RepID=Q2AB84_MONDO|nr:bitter taste receptor Modo-T2R62 precursor [Monodelphis domestica]BAE80383.1 bitter taste receptor [Monodelphis domestica]
MPNPITLFFMIFFLLESVIAIVENSFIFMILGREWMRCRTLPPGDIILASLGISRFFLQWMSIFSNFFTYFFPLKLSVYFGTFWTFSNMTTFWFTTCLGVFYCVKISAFTHPVFLWLKWRIPQMIHLFLFCSLLTSILLTTPQILTTFLTFQVKVPGNSSEKTILEDKMCAYRIHYFMPMQLFILLLPFLFFLVSIIFLISTLCRHLGKMQHHSSSLQDPSMQVHITALKSLFFFLILYTSYFLPLIISTIIPISVSSSWFWVREVVTYAGISIHPAFLILNSPKLRGALKKIFHVPEAA